MTEEWQNILSCIYIYIYNVCEREREKERVRERARERLRERIYIYIYIYIMCVIERERKTEREKDREREGQRERERVNKGFPQSYISLMIISLMYILKSFIHVSLYPARTPLRNYISITNFPNNFLFVSPSKFSNVFPLFRLERFFVKSKD